jgi:hypothetical protein
MKIKIWPNDTTVPEMDEWLAELRDEGRAESFGNNRGEFPAAPEPFAAPEPPTVPEPAAVSVTPPEPPAVPEPPAGPEAFAPPEPAAVSVSPAESVMPAAPAEPAMPAALAEPAASPEPAPEPAPAPATMRPIIGDQLRMPIIWCEMGSCISWHADPAALGEGDTRARAIEAGWRLDAFGRMACPHCQQVDPGFRNPYPVVPWDRHTAVARAARAAAAYGGVHGGVHDGAHAPGR